MEETKFFTKGKIIVIVSILVIIGLIFGINTIYTKKQKEKFIKLENDYTMSAPNYLLMKNIVLKKGQWRKINIRRLEEDLISNELSKKCTGYVLATANKNTAVVSYKANIKCGRYYSSSNSNVKLSKANENKSKAKDVEAPNLKLIGKSTMTIKLNEKYKEPGATAIDNVDGDITDKIKITGDVDTSIVGTYTLTYKVSDKAGNKSTKKRKILVKEDAQKATKDTTKPVISFSSNIEQTICTGTSMNISKDGIYGYVAYDDTDGDITDKVVVSGDTGVINSEGTYTLKYTVTDKAKNTAVETRTFKVKECKTETPVVTQPTPQPTPQPQQPVVSVTGVTINCSQIGKGSTAPVSYSVLPENATNKTVRFTSSNTSVASVDSSGNVTGINVGTANITIISTSSGKMASCTLRVQ